jgi:hypothetical protein
MTEQEELLADLRRKIAALVPPELVEREMIKVRLHDKNVCPDCTARAMASLGSAAAIQLFEEMIVHLREHDAPAPERSPSAELH